MKAVANIIQERRLLEEVSIVSRSNGLLTNILALFFDHRLPRLTIRSS
jgi:hypothetical protein